MEEFNILATAQRAEEGRLLRALRRLGEFTHSGFRDVVIGRVKDIERFLEEIEVLRQRSPNEIAALSQIVPIERSFRFNLENIMDKLKEALLPYADVIDSKSFYVRVVRRGHKGELSSLEIEQALDAFMRAELEKRSQEVRIDFKDPDLIIVVETVADLAGVGLISRQMKEKYPFIRIK